jgi:thioredoxin-like negative regulator of GroEL
VSGTRKEQIEAMLRDEPDDPFLRYGLAMEHVSAGADQEALRCLHGLLEIAPAYVPAYVQAGRALIRLGRDDEARAVLQAGIAAAEKQGDAHAAGEMAGFLQGLED